MSWTLVPAAQFGQHAPAWRALHAACGGSPLLAEDFVRPLLAEFGAGTELLGLYRQDGRVAAMTLLAPRGLGRWETFQPAQAPLGIWLQDPALALAPLAAALTRALPGFAVLLGVTQCDPDLLARPSGAHAADTLDYIQTARITLAGGFDAYWQARGKNLRGNLSKQRARLGRAGLAPRLEVWRAPGQMAAAVADYARLESAGWKGGAGTAVGAGDAQGRFYRHMLEAFCARGAGCVYRYWFGAQLVATDLCIEGGGALVVLKTAYDESAADGLSPALLMREEACRQLFGEGRLARIEFYGKVMEWHLRWTDEVRTLYHLNNYRWPALRRLHRQLRAGTAANPRME